MHALSPLNRVNACSAPTRRAVQQRLIRVTAASSNGNPSSETNGTPLPPPLSLFHPFKSLPPSGQLIPTAEDMCDVMVRNCKERMYVFETPCEACSGTGLARGASSRGRGRGRGSLHMCLVCTGIGHVRRTTARSHPEEQWGIEPVTMARQQRLPGEPEQRTMPPDHRMTPDRKDRIRRATERLAAAAKSVLGGSSPSDTPPSEPADGAGAAASQPPTTEAQQNGNGKQQVNNIVSSTGRLPGQPSRQVTAGAQGRSNTP